MPFDRAQPFNDLPLLPPAAELESKVVLKQAITANRVLANLRGLAAQIPNQAVLISSIVLQEARLSSEIENIVTTNDELYRADADADGNTESRADRRELERPDPRTNARRLEVLCFKSHVVTGVDDRGTLAREDAIQLQPD